MFNRLTHPTPASLCLLLPLRLLQHFNHHSWPSYLHYHRRCTPTDVQANTCARTRPSTASRFLIRPPAAPAVLRPCILMALMMLHAALGPLKVNSLTSVVSRLRAALIDGPARRQRGCPILYNSTALLVHLLFSSTWRAPCWPCDPHQRSCSDCSCSL